MMQTASKPAAISRSEFARRNKRLIAEWDSLSRDEQISQRRACGGFPEGCYCSTDRLNDYQLARFQGLLGSPLDVSWQRSARIHTCCGSRQVWRHKTPCPACK